MAWDWGNFGGGAVSGASAGSSFGPWGALAGGVGGGLLGGFGGGGNSYEKAMHEYRKNAMKAQEQLNPFADFGKRGLGGYEDWLGQMKDPSSFINDLMGNYQESPYNKYLQDQSMRAANNMGSANGLSGSTPWTQFAQENAANIGQQGMDSWLKNVLGVNDEYGKGLSNQIGMGQDAANNIANIWTGMGNMGAQSAFGSSQFRNKSLADMFSGFNDLAQMFKGRGAGGIPAYLKNDSSNFNGNFN